MTDDATPGGPTPGEPTGGGSAPGDPGQGDRHRHWQTVLLAVIAAILLAIFIVVLVDVLTGSDDVEAPTASTATTSSVSETTMASVPTETTSPSSEPTTTTPATTPPTAEPTTAPTQPTTTQPTTTTPPTIPIEELLAPAIYPRPEMGVRYTDPVALTRDFADSYVGFSNATVGDFQAGDSRSGEVTVAAGDVGPVSTVFVRQLTDDDSWYVIGAATDNIRIESPDALDTVSSPITLSGTSTAFEGTVNFELRADGADEPVLTGFVMGGGMGDFAPYESTFDFESPGEGGGALIMLTYSAKDGTVSEVGAVRIFFG